MKMTCLEKESDGDRGREGDNMVISLSGDKMGCLRASVYLRTSSRSTTDFSSLMRMVVRLGRPGEGVL
jgi:hypothetical protein